MYKGDAHWSWVIHRSGINCVWDFFKKNSAGPMGAITTSAIIIVIIHYFFGIDFFRNFAGPIATITASTIAVVITSYFAWHQKEIASEKLRLDLFNKRYKIFEAAVLYYEALACWEGTDEQKESKAKFFMACQQSHFLFGEDVEKIFSELLDAGMKVIAFRENRQSFKSDMEHFQKLHNESIDIMLSLFPEHLRILKITVSSYMNFRG